MYLQFKDTRLFRTSVSKHILFEQVCQTKSFLDIAPQNYISHEVSPTDILQF